MSADAPLSQNVSIDTSPSPAQQALDAQRKAHLANPYPSAKERIDRIDRAIALLQKHDQDICDALMADYSNRPAEVTRVTDVMASVTSLKWSRKQVKRLMKPSKRSANFPMNLALTSAKVEYLPLGVVGNISPWNFPVNLSFSPLGAIFGAGNRCMLKPSELTPHTSELMAQMVASAYDPEEFTVITGGVEVASEFSGLRFDHLLFTGSTNIAKHVMSAAAKNLVPVTLELGGKNPVIISRSANLKLAAKRVMLSNTLNAGQICLAPDTIFVPKGMEAAVKQAFIDVTREMYSGADDKAYTEMLSDRYADRMRAMADEVEQRGGTVTRFFDDSNTGKAVSPCFMEGAPADTAAKREEIFGPLMVLESYDSIEDVVNTVNQGECPLAVYYFGSDRRELELCTRHIRSGGMTVNDILQHIVQDELPFGGVGHSGTGAYHGDEGFRNFSHAKSVFKQSPFDITAMLRPPYGKLLDAYIGLEMR